MLIAKLFQQPKYVVSLFVNVTRVLSYDINDAVYQYWVYNDAHRISIVVDSELRTKMPTVHELNSLATGQSSDNTFPYCVKQLFLYTRCHQTVS